MNTLTLPKRIEPYIVEATHEDVVEMMRLGEIFWKQTRYFKEGVDYDTDTVSAMVYMIMDEGVALIARADGEIVGLMLVIVHPFPMNNHHLIGVEWVFYIDPAHRRGGLGADLIAAAEHQLRGKQVKYFTMVSLSEVTPELANKLYEQLGFKQSETSFTKEIVWN